LPAGLKEDIRLTAALSTRVKRKISAVQLLKIVVLKVLTTENIILGLTSVLTDPHVMILYPPALALVLVFPQLLLLLPPPVHLSILTVGMVYVVMHRRHAVGMDVVHCRSIVVMVNVKKKRRK
jgi:hypothetical protein